jgi:hypothetical protein
VLWIDFLVIIWPMTRGGCFWPGFSMVGCGIGVVMNAWYVYFAESIDEDKIQREIDHLAQRR